MREIKFRAWDKDYEKMTYFDDEDYEYKPPFVFRLDQVFKKDSNYDDYEDFEYNNVTDIVEIMQFTGLYDKNGREIYTSDIVKITEKENISKHKIIPMRPIIAEIAWSDEYLAYILITISIKDAFENLGEYLDYEIEVIGNVWENIELLKEE